MIIDATFERNIWDRQRLELHKTEASWWQWDFLGQQGKSMLGFMHFLHTLKVKNKVPLHIEVIQSTDT